MENESDINEQKILPSNNDEASITETASNIENHNEHELETKKNKDVISEENSNCADKFDEVSKEESPPSLDNKINSENLSKSDFEKEDSTEDEEDDENDDNDNNSNQQANEEEKIEILAEIEEDTDRLFVDINYGTVLSYFERFGQYIAHRDFNLFKNIESSLANRRTLNRKFIEFHMNLLKNLNSYRHVKKDKWEYYLTKFVSKYSKKEGSLIEKSGYISCPVETRISIIKNLLEAQFDENSRLKQAIYCEKYDTENLRATPIGQDNTNLNYWYFKDYECSVRLFTQVTGNEKSWKLYVKETDQIQDLINELSADPDVIKLRATKRYKDLIKYEKKQEQFRLQELEEKEALRRQELEEKETLRRQELKEKEALIRDEEEKDIEFLISQTDDIVKKEEKIEKDLYDDEIIDNKLEDIKNEKIDNIKEKVENTNTKIEHLKSEESNGVKTEKIMKSLKSDKTQNSEADSSSEEGEERPLEKNTDNIIQSEYKEEIPAENNSDFVEPILSRKSSRSAVKRQQEIEVKTKAVTSPKKRVQTPKKQVTDKDESEDNDTKDSDDDVPLSKYKKNITSPKKAVATPKKGKKKVETESDIDKSEDTDDSDDDEPLSKYKKRNSKQKEESKSNKNKTPIKPSRKSVKKPVKEEIDDEPECILCLKSKPRLIAIICDSCDSGFHLTCLKPKLTLVPEGDWFCGTCSQDKLIRALETKLIEHDISLKEYEEEKLKKIARKTEADALAMEERKKENKENSIENNNFDEKKNRVSNIFDGSEPVGPRSCRTNKNISYNFDEYDEYGIKKVKKSRDYDLDNMEEFDRVLPQRRTRSTAVHYDSSTDSEEDEEEDSQKEGSVIKKKLKTKRIRVKKQIKKEKEFSDDDTEYGDGSGEEYSEEIEDEENSDSEEKLVHKMKKNQITQLQKKNRRKRKTGSDDSDESFKCSVGVKKKTPGSKKRGRRRPGQKKRRNDYDDTEESDITESGKSSDVSDESSDEDEKIARYNNAFANEERRSTRTRRCITETYHESGGDNSNDEEVEENNQKKRKKKKDSSDETFDEDEEKINSSSKRKSARTTTRPVKVKYDVRSVDGSEEDGDGDSDQSNEKVKNRENKNKSVIKKPWSDSENENSEIDSEKLENESLRKSKLSKSSIIKKPWSDKSTDSEGNVKNSKSEEDRSDSGKEPEKSSSENGEDSDDQEKNKNDQEKDKEPEIKKSELFENNDKDKEPEVVNSEEALEKIVPLINEEIKVVDKKDITELNYQNENKKDDLIDKEKKSNAYKSEMSIKLNGVTECVVILTQLPKDVITEEEGTSKSLDESISEYSESISSRSSSPKQKTEEKVVVVAKKTEDKDIGNKEVKKVEKTESTVPSVVPNVNNITKLDKIIPQTKTQTQNELQGFNVPLQAQPLPPQVSLSYAQNPQGFPQHLPMQQHHIIPHPQGYPYFNQTPQTNGGNILPVQQNCYNPGFYPPQQNLQGINQGGANFYQPPLFFQQQPQQFLQNQPGMAPNQPNPMIQQIPGGVVPLSNGQPMAYNNFSPSQSQSAPPMPIVPYAQMPNNSNNTNVYQPPNLFQPHLINFNNASPQAN